MDAFSVTFEGLDKLVSDMREMVQDADKELEAAVKDTTAEAMRLIVQATPRGPNGAGAWSMSFPSRLSGLVSGNNRVLWFLEWGTGLFTEAEDGKHAKYKITPKNGKALSFHWAGYSGGHMFQFASRVKDRKPIYRSAKGNGTVNKKLAGNMTLFKFVMHPGIKPVGMVRGNLPRIREIFQLNTEAAADRIIEQFTRGF